MRIPVRLVSEANMREHWAQRHKRKKLQQSATQWTLKGKKPPKPPMDVFLTRVAPRFMDTDNLVGSFKHCQDAIAAWLGLDDGDKRIVWHYGQKKGGVREYALEVEILTDKEGSK